MSLKADELKIYNSSVSELNNVNKRILRVYETASQNIRTKILDTVVKLEGGTITSDIAGYRIFRLTELQRQISYEIVNVEKELRDIIYDGYETNYVNIYYYEAYVFEKAVNLLPNLESSYGLNYPALNVNAVRDSFDPLIGDRITRVSTEFKLAVQDRVAATIAEGKTVKQLAKDIEKIEGFSEIYANRATAISRTEMLRAYSLGQGDAAREAEESGVEFDYIWNSTLDSRTRSDHVNENGKKATISNGEPLFVIEGVRLSGPRVVRSDNSVNSAAQVINCRCRRVNAPYGIKPKGRVVKYQSGEWGKVDFNTNAREWIDKHYPGVNVKDINIGIS